MLRKISSSNVLKKIYLLEDDDIKLRVIKYNKTLQNINNITIEDYIRLSGRYIEYETEKRKKGKEYCQYTNKLLYEGEYLNGERNGIGKEYYSDGS